MANPKTIRELLVKLGVKADDKPLERFNTGIERTKKGMLGLVKMAAVFTGGFALMAAGAIAAAVDTAAAGDAAAKTASQVGLTTASYQELEHAALMSNVEQQAFIVGMRTLARTAFMAGRGNKEQAATFAALGVSVHDVRGKLRPTDQLLGDIAEKFKGMPDDTRKTALAMRLFGGAGASLIPMLNEGKGGLKALREEAHKLGLVISDETAAQADEFGDRLDNAKQALTGMRNVIGAALLPVLTRVLTVFRDWVIANRDFVKAGAERAAKMLDTALKRILTTMYFLNAVAQKIGGWERVLKAATVAALALAAGFTAVMIAVNLTTIAVGLLDVAMAGLATLTAIAAFFGLPVWATAVIILAALVAAVAAVTIVVTEAAAIFAVAALAIDDFLTFMRGGDSIIGRFIDAWAKSDTVLGGVSRVLLAVRNAFHALLLLAEPVERIVGQLAERGFDKLKVAGAAVADVFSKILELLAQWNVIDLSGFTGKLDSISGVINTIAGGLRTAATYLSGVDASGNGTNPYATPRAQGEAGARAAEDGARWGPQSPGTGAANTMTMANTFHISGAQDPNATGTAVVQHIKRQLRQADAAVKPGER